MRLTISRCVGVLLILLLVGVPIAVSIQFAVTRSRILRLVDSVEVGASRAEVERVFAAYDMNDARFAHKLSRANGKTVVFSDPARSTLQGYEHVEIRFDSEGNVTSKRVVKDP